MKNDLIIWLILFSMNLIHAQNHLVGSSVYTGKVMAQSKDISYLIESGIQAIDVQWLKQANGNKYWHQLYRYPTYGFGLYGTTLGNQTYYGKSFSAFSVFNFPLRTPGHQFNINFPLALGLSYHHKIYDLENNIMNVAIGTHINALFQAGIEPIFYLTKHVILKPAIKFAHISNGKIKTPNLGFNMLMASIGISYQFQDFKPEPHIPDSSSYKKLVVETSLGIGLKSPSTYQYEQYPVYTIVANVGYQINQKRLIGIGCDFFYDKSIKHTMEAQDLSYVGNYQQLRIGLHLFHDLIIGNFIIYEQVGTYLYSEFYEYSDYYARLGIKYLFFNQRLFTKAALKASWGKADFVECGIGYRW